VKKGWVRIVARAGRLPEGKVEHRYYVSSI
jgi:hypothetical protein